MKVWLLASLIFVVLVSITLGAVFYPEFGVKVAQVVFIGAVVAFFAIFSIGLASSILGDE